MTQMIEDGAWAWVGTPGGEEQMGFGYILKTGLRGFVDEVDMGV